MFLGPKPRTEEEMVSGNEAANLGELRQQNSRQCERSCHRKAWQKQGGGW